MRSHGVIVLLAFIICSASLLAGQADAQKLFDDGMAVYAKNPDEAIAKFKAAIKEDPDFVQAYAALGWAYWEKKGDAEMAISYCKMALYHSPEWFLPHLMLGQIIFDQNTPESNREAARYFEEALDLMPNDSALAGQRLTAHISLGALYRRMGMYEGASIQLEKALQMDGKNILALNQMGLVCAARKQYGEARSWYAKALAVDADFAAAWYNTACAYALEGQKDSALTNLRTAIMLDKGYKEKAMKDPDFSGLRQDKEFKKLVGN